MAKSKLDKVYALLGGLARPDLVELRTTIEELLAASDAEQKPDTDPMLGSQVDSQGAPKGYLERKMINGYGPYLYLRLWRDGHLTSKYLGKAPADQPKPP